MENILASEIFGKAKETAIKKVEEYIKDHEWKKFFVESGEFLASKLDAEESFRQDLLLVFSEKNMRELALKMKNNSGIELITSLEKELQMLFQRYEIDSNDARIYIQHFSNQIIQYLRDNLPGEYWEVLFAEKWNWEKNEFANVREGLTNIEKKVDTNFNTIPELYSIEKINDEIKRLSRNQHVDLSFFDVDDESFHISLGGEIRRNNTMISIEGASREETFYRVLNELNQHYSDKKTIIIQSEEQWEKLGKSELTGHIILPYFFYSDGTYAIPGNINLFIYGMDDGCPDKEKIKLRKRRKEGIVESLKKIGKSDKDAWHLVHITNGLYASMKRHLFYYADGSGLQWGEEEPDIFVAALCCGKWTESAGDQEVMETLSGEKYEKCMSFLRKYDSAEKPYIIQRTNHHGKHYQIACIEDAWIMLDSKVDSNFMVRFFEQLLFVMNQRDAENSDLKAYIKAVQNGTAICKWSPELKKGMLRTLVMWTCVADHAGDQKIIDRIVMQILDSVTDAEGWAYISSYIGELCEASPASVLVRLEQEVDCSTGMMELFEEGSKYVEIQWAIEQLLQQKRHLRRVIRLLWKIDSKNYNYKWSNNPGDLLEDIFQPWIHLIDLSGEEKISEAKEALEQYETAWRRLGKCLPDVKDMVFSTLSTPQYRKTDDMDQNVSPEEVSMVYFAYLEILSKAAGSHADRWCLILEKLYKYPLENQEKTFALLIHAINGMTDDGRIEVKQKIRGIIYKHRYFYDAGWAMDEGNIQLYENALNQIIVKEAWYDYLYLFIPSYDFPLLHPVPYDRDESAGTRHDRNELLTELEITQKFKEFKENGLPISELVSKALERKEIWHVGEVLAQYYDEGTYNEKTFSMIMELDCSGDAVIGYVGVNGKETKILREIVSTARRADANEDLIARIISCQSIKEEKDCILFSESEGIKRAFWKRRLRINISLSNHALVIKALRECREYGNLDSYMELLFVCLKVLSPEEALNSFIQAKDMSGVSDASMTGWHIEEILEKLHQSYLDNPGVCLQIGMMEIWFWELIHWDKMKCTQKMVKETPQLYAQMVAQIYRSDTEEQADKKKQDRAMRLFDRFYHMHFCPGEDSSGNVDYDSLNQWSEMFRKLLREQDQESLWDSLMGRLLSDSLRNESARPEESICRFIENYYTDRLGNSYLVAVLNKRGVYVGSGGENEKKLAEKYKSIAEDMVKKRFDRTAEIYEELSSRYDAMAEEERKQAEDGE